MLKSAEWDIVLNMSVTDLVANIALREVKVSHTGAYVFWSPLNVTFGVDLLVPSKDCLIIKLRSQTFDLIGRCAHISAFLISIPVFNAEDLACYLRPSRFCHIPKWRRFRICMADKVLNRQILQSSSQECTNPAGCGLYTCQQLPMLPSVASEWDARSSSNLRRQMGYSARDDRQWWIISTTCVLVGKFGLWSPCTWPKRVLSFDGDSRDWHCFRLIDLLLYAKAKTISFFTICYSRF